MNKGQVMEKFGFKPSTLRFVASSPILKTNSIHAWPFAKL